MTPVGAWKCTPWASTQAGGLTTCAFSCPLVHTSREITPHWAFVGLTLGSAGQAAHTETPSGEVHLVGPSGPGRPHSRVCRSSCHLDISPGEPGLTWGSVCREPLWDDLPPQRSTGQLAGTCPVNQEHASSSPDRRPTSRCGSPWTPTGHRGTNKASYQSTSVRVNLQVWLRRVPVAVCHCLDLHQNTQGQGLVRLP